MLVKDAWYNVKEHEFVFCFVQTNTETKLLKVYGGDLGRYLCEERNFPVSPVYVFEKLILRFTQTRNHPTYSQNFDDAGGEVIRYYLTENQLQYIEESDPDI